MSIPFTVDISAFYGEPDFREQNSGSIVDRRKTLNLHKKLEGNYQTKKSTRSKGGRNTSSISGNTVGGAISMNNNTAGAFSFGNTRNYSKGGAISMNNKGGALAFNEQQLMNELSGLKKGGALGALAATVIPTLIQMAPQIISAIKESSKAQGGRNTSGGAIKLGGAAAVFIDGVEPDKYPEMLKTLKMIERQRKNLIRDGGAIRVGSGKFGDTMKKAWNSIKSWYGNNADKLKPITDILLHSAVETAGDYINKGVQYVGDKTGSSTMKEIADVVGDMAKGSVNKMANQIASYGTTQQQGSGYDIDNLQNDTEAVGVVSKKKKRILTALPQNQNQIHASVITRRKKVY